MNSHSTHQVESVAPPAEPDLQGVFIDPRGNNADDVRQIMGHAVSVLLDALCQAAHRPILPDESAFDEMDPEVPDHPRTNDAMQEELRRVIRLSLNPAHPQYIGHMDSLPTLYSVIGSLYASALNNNMFSLEMSPYFTRLEYALVKAFAARFGFSETASGVIVSGGTLANVQAIVTARNHYLGRGDGEISASSGTLVLFASEHAHVSIAKAAMIGGIGSRQVIRVAADHRGKMIVADLEEKIERALAEGQQPFAVVGTIGTTVTGNIDPIADLARICQQYRLWFHADAIYGGALILSPNERHRLQGIGMADSISFNPQKWMHISKTCSLLLFRQGQIMHNAFRQPSSYTRAQDRYINLSEVSLQGTKHAEVLKLWLSLQSIGWTGYGTLVDRACAMAQKFQDRIGSIRGVEWASSREMNITTFRLRTQWEDVNDKVNEAFNDYALREHMIFFSLPRYNGRLWQRTILLNPFMDERTIENVYEAIHQFIGKHIELSW